MAAYQVKHCKHNIAGALPLTIRSLLDRQQYSDPLGAAARMGISSASWPLFGLLWPSGIQLAGCVANHPVTASERILEIGCGLALASLVGHRRGADMTASDCHPLAASFLRENGQLNDITPVPYRHGMWSGALMAGAAQERQPHPVVSGRFDLIVGSDILYERDDSGSLPWFIAQHAAPGAQIWIVDPDRSNRAAFNRQMAGLGLSMSERRIDVAASSGVDAYKGRLLKYGWS
jgi:predicted nicotinamide N-methyase